MRRILEESRIHEGVRSTVGELGAGVIDEIESVVQKEKIVVVGMAMAISVKQAKSYLQSAAKPYTYLEYGSYLGGWKERAAIKMWSGWTTFPLVFVDGQLIGGASDLKQYIAAGLLT